MTVRILCGDAIDRLRELPADSVHCVVTSPPYWGLRDYGTGTWEGGEAGCDHKVREIERREFYGNSNNNCSSWHVRDGSTFRDLCGKCGARRIDQQIGLEATPEAWAAKLVEVFREVRRVLRPDGCCFVNVGDSYASSPPGNKTVGVSAKSGLHGVNGESGRYRETLAAGHATKRNTVVGGLKPKDLIGQPWLLAFALRADGWWLRSEIIWCLSGGTRVYARTQKGEMPTTIKDLVRLDPATVQLWNGEKWTQVLGWSETPRPDRTYEIELRSGERIGCTAGHLWPTHRGNVRADEIQIGDVIKTCRLPEPEQPRRPVMLPDKEIGWLVGLYLAEGSRGKDGKVIQIASHTEEAERFERLRVVAKAYDGTFAAHPTGSPFAATANIYSPTLAGVLETYLAGNGAAGKRLTARCWRRSNVFLRSLLEGYLEADGHFEAGNNRWKLGFTANDGLAEDLRTLCARLGVCLRLRRCEHTFAGRGYPGWRGEIRFERSAHGNCRDDGEVVAIRESRARKFWDIGVADEPHLFALASGVLTHNSKPNPMPESVRDRPTKAHEQVFLLTKSERYFWDSEAVREGVTGNAHTRRSDGERTLREGEQGTFNGRPGTWQDSYLPSGRNLRTVWTIATEPFPEAHFATFPTELARRCILAGTSAKGCCPACGAPWARVMEHRSEPQGNAPRGKHALLDINGTHHGQNSRRGEAGSFSNNPALRPPPPATLGWRPSCACTPSSVGLDPRRDYNGLKLEPIPCTVLDPFGGSGTVGLVADQLGRDAVLIELSPDYAAMAERRLAKARARRLLGPDAPREAPLPGQGVLL